MRDIKFRAWDGDRMFYPDKGCDLLVRIDGKLFVDIDVKENIGLSQAPESLKLMQYIGMKDKNGKEIYQGDILKVQSDKAGYGEVSYGGIIKVTIETCGYLLKPIRPTFEEMEENFEPWDSSSLWHVCEIHSETGEGTTEVVGNVYENPELLSKELREKE